MARLFSHLVPACMALLLGTGAAMAADPACKPVTDALRKLNATPFHETVTRSGGTLAGANGGAPSQSEVISTGGMTYVLARGKWVAHKAIPVSPEKLDADAARASCSHLRDETAPVAASVYQMRETIQGGRVEGQIWIAKATGLPLRQEQDVDLGTGGRTHTVMRFDYQDVKAPKLN